MKIFDGHNDALLSIHRPDRGKGRQFLARSEHGHIDLPRARQGGLAGGLFAIFPPPLPEHEPDVQRVTENGTTAEVKTLPPLPMDEAQRQTDAMIELFNQIVADSDGNVIAATDVATIERAFTEDGDTLAAVLHFEGAEAIDTELEALQRYYDAGLRSLGLTWSRSNAFAHGVPFKFPGSPDIGPGLTEAGEMLVRACNELGIVIDLSHLNEAGFRDVAELSDAPLVASHSNAHALCPAARNLTDEQLTEIAQSDGIVGINYAVIFLREDGRNNADTPISLIADHLLYIADRIGIEHVGLGSDFDGATVPAELGDVTGLPKLIELLQQRGFTDDDLQRIAYRNWLRVLRKTWR